MLSTNDPIVLVAWSARICCVGLLLQSLELTSLWREMRDGHLLGWHGDGCGPNVVRRMLRRSQGFPVCLLVLLWRLAAAAACLVLPVGGVAVVGLLASLVVCQLYYNRRFQLVFTNADNLTLIVLGGVTVGAMPGASDALRITALGFLAFQALLAYEATGIDKLRAVNWRDGSRLIQVFQDSSHRFSPLGNFLAAWPGVARGLSWAIIMGEMAFPFSLFLPREYFLGALAAGLLFHAMIGALMGLPMFFWAFASTYPALYFAQAWVEAAIRR